MAERQIFEHRHKFVFDKLKNIVERYNAIDIFRAKAAELRNEGTKGNDRPDADTSKAVQNFVHERLETYTDEALIEIQELLHRLYAPPAPEPVLEQLLENK